MPPRNHTADLRTIRTVWIAVIAGVAMMTVAFAGLTWLGIGRTLSEHAAMIFYANAALNLAAVLGAFTVHRRMLDRLPYGGAYEEVVADVRLSGIVSLAILEGSVLVAGLAAVLTGEAFNLLFAVPFFAFAALFFPTRARFENWLALAERP